MGRSPTILFAEDDPDDFVFVRRAFEKSAIKYNLVHVSNGQQAVNYLHGDGPYHDRVQYPIPDLLLLDLKMPMKDGFEVLASLREQPLGKELPIVIFTGSNQDCDVQIARAMGAADIQIKPLETDALAALVKNLETRWLRLDRE